MDTSSEDLSAQTSAGVAHVIINACFAASGMIDVIFVSIRLPPKAAPVQTHRVHSER